MAGIPQIGGDSQNTMPIALQSGMQARQMVQATEGEVAKAASWKDVFSKSTLDAVKDQTARNVPLSDALQQQTWFVRMARKLPFVGDKLTQFLGPKATELNDAIAGLSKEALGSASKAQITNAVLKGGDVAKNLEALGLAPEAAKDLASKAAAATAESAAKAGATGVAQQAGKAVATEVAQTAGKGVANETIESLMKGLTNGGVLKGKVVSPEAIQKVLSSNPEDMVAALRQIGLRADAAKAVAAEAVKSGSKQVATQAAGSATKQAATQAAESSAKSGVKGFFGKLLGGAKGNFIIAGIFSLGSNAIQLATGKMNLKQFAALTVADTAAYGGIGMASAAAGAAIGSVVPVFGTAIGFVAGLGLGLLGGHLYEKFLRNPIKNMLGGPSGGGAPSQVGPSSAPVGPGEYQDPYQAQPKKYPEPAPVKMPWESDSGSGAGGVSYEQAMSQLNGQ
jgi:hypothetical protein